MDGTKYADLKKRKPHPVDRGNIFKKLFFCWLLPYLSKGLKKEIDEDDMYETSKSQESARLGNKLEFAWMNETRKTNPSLLKALFIVFRAELSLYALFMMFTESVKIVQPMLISKLVSFFQPNSTKANPGEIYTYAAIIVLSSFVQVLCNHHYQMRVMTLGMKVRVAACSLIYRKSLKLSKSALAETTVGQMVNLLSNDVGRFDFAAQHIHNLWIAPVETVIVMYLLYIYVGPSGLVGTVFLLLFIPFQMYMAKLTSKFRLKTAIRTDERVRLMNEIISGIQVIKMYTWEKPFAKLVDIVRKREIDQIRATSIIRAILMSCNLVLVRGAIYICILTYIFTGNTLTATYAYTISSFYGLLQLTVIMFFPQAVIQFAETRVSVKRIQQFLLHDELSKNTIIENGHLSNGVNGKKCKDIKSKEGSIHLKNMSVKWLRSLPENTLENINFNASSKQLVAVVGPVGGGKSTLLHAILKELSPVEGYVDIEGDASYASQEPWLFGGNVRQNILFGQEYDATKYEEVVRVCALERDFALFSNGDRTLVGQRGVALSGGQRARINLARAVYKESDIYLLDDPLSAVDTHVGKQLFNDCICGYLRNKCVVLVTHQLQFLKSAHCIYLLEDGRVRASGTYKELKNSDSDFTKLLEESKEEVKKEEMRRLSRTEQKDEADNDKLPEVSEEREQRASGIITWHVYRSYLRAGGNWCKTIAVLSLFPMSQIFGSMTDYFITHWVNLEQLKDENRHHEAVKAIFNDTSSNNSISALSTIPMPENPENMYESIMTQHILIIIYTCLVLLVMFTSVTRSILFFRYCMTASTRLHNSMFSKIVYSTMTFFNTNPTGRILNRFSKDIGAIDETLPLTIVDTLGIGLAVAAITLVIATVNPWILVSSVIISMIFYSIRKVFLASSRNIKRVEAITRSPIYTHLAASLQGVTTIRAFGAEEVLTKEFDNYQDAYTSAFFMFLSVNRGFGFWLDMHCVIYIGLVTISILFLQSETFGGNVGLSLTQAMGLSGMFQFGMRQWSELENQMTSVERVQEYADIVPERDTNTKEPPKLWPDAGKVEFVNVFLSYSIQDPPVLKNLIFEIKPREKIGIVGRTGAGKSSLIQALFRLTDIEGSILIDGVDTKTVSLNILRSKISIIPQEPVLFSGTLRKNLDPFDEYQDEILWSALEEVELKNAVDELPAGLDSKMAEGGSNFSVGQRQLLCLARAIVRNNKILVLDEATANVDLHTDGLIQGTLRRKFANCTVLTIAHRLNTIMDSDRVLVMDAGKVVEFDHPNSLLQNKNGVFYELVKQTGLAMAENLRAIAEESFNSKTATHTSLLYMAKLTSKYRLRTAICTDERVRLMNEIISGIQVIKMYTWEKPFTKLVQIVREREIGHIRATSIIRAIMMSCNLVMARSAVCLCVLTYVLTGNTLTATYAYTVSSFYGLLRVAVTQFFPQAITQFAETNVSVKRIQHFLLYEELSKNHMVVNDNLLNGVNGKVPTDKKHGEVGIRLKNVSVKWLKSLTENTLENINFNATSKRLVAVVGPVGGGKSTLLHAILKELPPVEGSVDIEGTASYASQEPWLFGGSVRQNILFGQEYDPTKYEEVVRVCALQRDFSLFPHGDRTLVGERGVTLSGGQRARINLARAVYKEADIYLLDDPLSAVDTHVGKQLFNDCICGYLKNKCVVLVTHQLQFLRSAHCIYLLEDGRVRTSGTYQDLRNSDSDFTNLLAEFEEEEKKEEIRRLSKIEQNDKSEEEELPVISLEREERASGIITWHVYRSYLKAGGNWCKTIAVLLLFLVSQIFGSSTDYFLTIWVNLEQWRVENNTANPTETLLSRIMPNDTISSTAATPTPRMSQSVLDSLLTKDIAIAIYGCLVLLTMFLTVTRSISFFRYCMMASTRLHNSMFSKIVFSTMRFFNTNPSGRILNRFSKDIGAVDETLPITIVDTMQIGLLVLAITLVIASLNPWILLPTVIILIIFYFLRRTFLVSSRSIKRVEAITRSPIYTHLAASLQGLTTIRAFDAEEILIKEFDNYQDGYSSAYYMFLTINRGFGFWLDLHCVTYIALVLLSTLILQGETFGGNVGLSLTQAMSLSGMFQWGMRQWSELENQMTSVERVQEYADILPERDTNTKEPPKFWPDAGNLEFANLSLRYAENDPPVLKNLTFKIEPREKIGIVGRTGAGKSSLIQALFRLADTEGSILIDGVDTKTVSLKTLRSKISIIPQEPVLFSGTLRKNLDPFDEYHDEILWNALEEVELKHAVDELPAGLDSKMAEGGSNFSVGQRQLLCLARAIVRNNKILVLDEATANVDPQTDGLIQSTIRQKFANCTVLTIAHRLHTIMDSDKVLVMDAGEAVEFDHPFELLHDRNGVFYGLVKQTGAAMAENLQAIAEENFTSRSTEQTSL